MSNGVRFQLVEFEEEEDFQLKVFEALLDLRVEPSRAARLCRDEVRALLNNPVELETPLEVAEAILNRRLSMVP